MEASNKSDPVEEFRRNYERNRRLARQRRNELLRKLEQDYRRQSALESAKSLVNGDIEGDHLPQAIDKKASLFVGRI